MNKYIAGFIAGFIATVVFSLLMLVKDHLGFVPQFNIIRDFDQFFGIANILFGWQLHFLLGTFIWGGLFAFFAPFFSGSYVLRGIYFGMLAWLLMMIAYMPVMSHGLFTTELSVEKITATFVLHVIYGAVLGWVYSLIPKKMKRNKP